MWKALRNGFLAAVAFAGTVALAQNFTASVQLSQDPRGPLPIDSNQNIYITNNRHLLSFLGASPGPSVSAACGTTGQSVSGTDFQGTITVGGTATTSCPLTFGQAFLTAPTCVLAPKSGILAAFSWTTSTTGFTVTQTSTASNTISYVCSSVS